MRRPIALLSVILILATVVYAKSKEEERLENCATVMTEILNVPDDIPQDLLDKAECIVVLPSVKKGAFIVGFRGGRGAAVCRTGEKMDGPWGPPAMYELTFGPSVGFQIGGEATDFVLLIMNPAGAKKLLQSKFTLGADASVAGGPKGRTAEAATDAQMHAEILTYSRTRGAFAGVSLEGSPLSQDADANKKIYGRKIEAKEILFESAVAVPPAGKALVDLLNTKSPTNKSDK
ncbi:MAG TPA: lipid-binding SYLF domain-containing protein [Candidatus Xenobia bacterium]|nr:lipid-binding SYLF domain-containing protein [Candidatus Xenobia bacterium]